MYFLVIWKILYFHLLRINACLIIPFDEDEFLHQIWNGKSIAIIPSKEVKIHEKKASEDDMQMLFESWKLGSC